MDQHISFTAFLKDEYSTRFQKLAGMSDSVLKKIDRDLSRVSVSGKTVSRSIDDINKRIAVLEKTKKLTIDTTAIRFANREIRSLIQERERLEGNQSSSGGLGMPFGRGIAIAGAGLAIGSILQETGQHVLDAAKRYETYEAVLTNTLGTMYDAKKQMADIQLLAAKTPFSVDELTESFVKLANGGFKPSMAELTTLGDLASSTGKSFGQLSEALLDAQTLEFERLKEFGIKARKVNGNDDIMFTFKGVTKEVKATSDEIRNYILSLGQAKGVTGSMDAISKTTSGSISNLGDSVDLIYKALAERFKPEIQSSIGVLSSFANTIRTWIEIPVEEKLKKEINQIGVLQTELTSANTTEERRKAILLELEKINPRITEGISAQNIEYAKLAENIDKVIGGLKKQITLEGLNKEFKTTLADWADLSSQKESIEYRIRSKMYDIAPHIATNPNLTDAQKREELKRYIQQQREEFYKKRPDQRGLGVADIDVRAKYVEGDLGTLLNLTQQIQGMTPKYNAFVQKRDAMMGQIDQALNKSGNPSLEHRYDPDAGKQQGNGKEGPGIKTRMTRPRDGFADRSVPAISAAGGVKNIQINIGSLVSGGVNITTTIMRESANRAKDIVVEALLTAVNDANYIDQ